MRLPWPRRRRDPLAGHPPRSALIWADLVHPSSPASDDAQAQLAADVQEEAARLGRLAAVLNEPTVVINRQLRIPGYLARGWEDE